MDRGYVKLWRKLIDSPVFADSEMLKLAVWCLIRARRKKGSVSMLCGKVKKVVPLDAGQFVTGRMSGAEELGWSPSTFRNRMTRLCAEPFSFVTAKKDSNFTVVTVCNWDIYQMTEDEEGQQNRTSEGQAKDKRRTSEGHKQECKNERMKEYIGEPVEFPKEETSSRGQLFPKFISQLLLIENRQCAINTSTSKLKAMINEMVAREGREAAGDICAGWLASYEYYYSRIKIGGFDLQWPAQSWEKIEAACRSEYKRDNHKGDMFAYCIQEMDNRGR